jgi:hypothetical protein
MVQLHRTAGAFAILIKNLLEVVGYSFHISLPRLPHAPRVAVFIVAVAAAWDPCPALHCTPHQST